MDGQQFISPQQEVDIKTECPDFSEGEEENVGENWADISIKSEINTTLETKESLEESKDHIDPFNEVFETDKSSNEFVKMIKLEALKTEDDVSHKTETDNSVASENEDLFLNSDNYGLAGTVDGQKTQNCISTKELENLLDDATFRKLEKHFLMTRRGRRPDLPHVETITNKHLLQLSFLRKKSGSSMTMLKSWLEVLDPTLSSLAQGQLDWILCNLYDKCIQLNKEEVVMFLERAHDFHAVAEPLASLGLTRSHLLGLEEYRAPSGSIAITNEVVLALDLFRMGEGFRQRFVMKWIANLYSEFRDLTVGKRTTRVHRSLRMCRRLKSAKNYRHYQYFLKEEFDIHDTRYAFWSEKCRRTPNIMNSLQKEKCNLKSSNQETLITEDDARHWTDQSSIEFVKETTLEGLKTEDDAHNIETDNSAALEQKDLFLNSEEHGQQEGTDHGEQTQNCLSTAELECLLDDDTFRKLESHFLMTGNGKSADLPHVETVTNRLLLQLLFLRQKPGCSGAMLKSWLDTVDPPFSSVTEARVFSRLHKSLDKCTKLKKEEVLVFLEKPHNILAVAEPLASLGLTLSHLLGLEEYRAPSDSAAMTNEVVVALEYFRNKEKSPHSVFRKLILTLCSESAGLTKGQLKTKVHNVLKRYRQLKRNRRGQQDVQDFLKEEFDARVSVKPRSDSETCAHCVIKERELSRKEDILKILEKKKIFSGIFHSGIDHAGRN